MSRSTIRWRAATPLVDMVERMPLNRVALTVVRERSAAFYGDHSGLTQRIHDDEHLLILGSGDGSELALSEGDPVAPQLPRTIHFGLRLENDQAVRAVRERLRDAGITGPSGRTTGGGLYAGKSQTPTGIASAVRRLIQGRPPACALSAGGSVTAQCGAWMMFAGQILWTSR